MPRTHGWAGRPPATDDEAIARIVAAAQQCIAEHGARTNVADIARVVGVGRQTIYRYFASTEALLLAASTEASGQFLVALEKIVSAQQDARTAIIESIAFTIEQLPHEPYMGALLSVERLGFLARSVTSEFAMTMGRAMLGPLRDEWRGQGATNQQIDELIEWNLRILQSVLIDPGRPPREGSELRNYLARWLGPALDSFLSNLSTKRASALFDE